MFENLKKIFFLMVLAAVVWTYPQPVWAEKTASPPNKIPQIITPKTFVKLAKRLNPAVVNISTARIVRGHGRYRDPFFDDFFDLFFRGVPRRRYQQRSLGSGFLINENGYILTNKHVIKGMDAIKITLQDKSEYMAEVVGVYDKLDIGLIKISSKKKKFPTVLLGDSDKLEVGDWVMAIGNPFGLDHTVTTGIISAKGRVIGAGPYDDFIQTDASINPGNSGGPLFNLAGEVVGINTAVLQSGQGIGFAIPINMAREIIDKLIGTGSEQAWLGLHLQKMTPQLAGLFGMSTLDGALVSEVVYGSPAKLAGIEVGDIVVGLAGKTVKKPADFRGLIAGLEPYSKVVVEIIRSNRKYRLQLTLSRKP